MRLDCRWILLPLLTLLVEARDERAYRGGKAEYQKADRKGETQFQHKKTIDGAVLGCFGYVDGQGKMFVTHYMADVSGYRSVSLSAPDKLTKERIKALRNGDDGPVSEVFPIDCTEEGDVGRLQRMADKIKLDFENGNDDVEPKRNAPSYDDMADARNPSKTDKNNVLGNMAAGETKPKKGSMNDAAVEQPSKKENVRLINVRDPDSFKTPSAELTGSGKKSPFGRDPSSKAPKESTQQQKYDSTPKFDADIPDKFDMKTNAQPAQLEGETTFPSLSSMNADKPNVEGTQTAKYATSMPEAIAKSGSLPSKKGNVKEPDNELNGKFPDSDQSLKSLKQPFEEESASLKSSLKTEPATFSKNSVKPLENVLNSMGKHNQPEEAIDAQQNEQKPVQSDDEFNAELSASKLSPKTEEQSNGKKQGSLKAPLTKASVNPSDKRSKTSTQSKNDPRSTNEPNGGENDTTEQQVEQDPEQSDDELNGDRSDSNSLPKSSKQPNKSSPSSVKPLAKKGSEKPGDKTNTPATYSKSDPKATNEFNGENAATEDQNNEQESDQPEDTLNGELNDFKPSSKSPEQLNKNQPSSSKSTVKKGSEKPSDQRSTPATQHKNDAKSTKESITEDQREEHDSEQLDDKLNGGLNDSKASPKSPKPANKNERGSVKTTLTKSPEKPGDKRSKPSEQSKNDPITTNESNEEDDTVELQDEQDSEQPDNNLNNDLYDSKSSSKSPKQPNKNEPGSVKSSASKSSEKPGDKRGPSDAQSKNDPKSTNKSKGEKNAAEEHRDDQDSEQPDDNVDDDLNDSKFSPKSPEQPNKKESSSSKSPSKKDSEKPGEKRSEPSSQTITDAAGTHQEGPQLQQLPATAARLGADMEEDVANHNTDNKPSMGPNTKADPKASSLSDVFSAPPFEDDSSLSGFAKPSDSNDVLTAISRVLPIVREAALPVPSGNLNKPSLAPETLPSPVDGDVYDEVDDEEDKDTIDAADPVQQPQNGPEPSNQLAPPSPQAGSCIEIILKVPTDAKHVIVRTEKAKFKTQDGASLDDLVNKIAPGVYDVQLAKFDKVVFEKYDVPSEERKESAVPSNLGKAFDYAELMPKMKDSMFTIRVPEDSVNAYLPKVDQLPRAVAREQKRRKTFAEADGSLHQRRIPDRFLQVVPRS